MEENKQDKPQVKPLYYSEEYWNRPKEDIIKEAQERQMRARAYEAEYYRQLQEGKAPFHKTSEEILKDAEKRFNF